RTQAPPAIRFVATVTIAEEGLTLQYPAGWQEAAGMYSNATVLHKLFQKETGQIVAEGAEGAAAAGITIHIEHWKSPEEATRRLNEIAAGSGPGATSTTLKVQGYPAVTVQYRLVMPGIGRDDDEPARLPQPDTGNQEVFKVITAVAADSRVILL